jgi:hypothetical protein
MPTTHAAPLRVESCRGPAPRLMLVPPPRHRSETLPLSWSWGPETRFRARPLPSGVSFVYEAEVERSTSLLELVDDLHQAFPHGFIVRGCSDAFVRLLALRGGRALQLGCSARVDLTGYRPPHHARGMARRGARTVQVRELATDAATQQQLAPWLASLRAPGVPALRYLWRSTLDGADRAFAAYTPGATSPSGLVTLTNTGGGVCHTELLCRDPGAPAGTMEHLLCTIVERLQKEGLVALNLGEVGLDFETLGPTQTWLDRGVQRVAALARRWAKGRFDVAGLHQFKNKFDPCWEPRFFYGSRGLGLGDLWALASAARVTELL